MTRKNAAFTNLIQKLEAERNDLTWTRTPEPVVVETVRRVYPSKHVQQQREQRFFAAGRYSAGARDKVAVAAHAWLMKELDL